MKQAAPKRAPRLHRGDEGVVRSRLRAPSLPIAAGIVGEGTPSRRRATPSRRRATPSRRRATPSRRRATPSRRRATPSRRLSDSFTSSSDSFTSSSDSFTSSMTPRRRLMTARRRLMTARRRLMTARRRLMTPRRRLTTRSTSSRSRSRTGESSLRSFRLPRADARTATRPAAYPLRAGSGPSVSADVGLVTSFRTVSARFLAASALFRRSWTSVANALTRSCSVCSSFT